MANLLKNGKVELGVVVHTSNSKTQKAEEEIYLKTSEDIVD